MEPLTGSIWALALAIVSASVLWIFRTNRIEALENKHNMLDRSVAVLTQEVKHLSGSIDKLAAVIKHMDERRVSGRQPRA